MKDYSRRKFIKKAFYVAPIMVSLGTLTTPLDASPHRKTSHIGRGEYETKVGSGFSNYKREIDD